MSNTSEILQLVAAGSMNSEEAAKKIAQLNKASNSIRYKVSKKGCISFYGIRRMPISLYLSELEEIVNTTMEDNSWNPEFQSFIDENKDSLSSKKK